jgi:AcrR family transcriptional regulator
MEDVSAMPGNDKRERIIEAAMKLFEEQGYHGTKVSNIVKEAGMAQGTFYLYFKSKEDLFRSVAESCLDEIAMALAVNAEGESVLSQENTILYRTIHKALTVYYHNRMIVSMLNRIGAASPEIQDISRHFYGKMAALIQATFRKFKAYPHYTDQQLEMTAYAKIGMVEMVAYHWFIEKGAGLESIDEMTKVLIGVNINCLPEEGASGQ